MTEFKEIVNKDTRDQLKRYIEAIEGYEAEKKELADKLNCLYSEIKATGFCAKTIKKIVADRKKDKNKLLEEQYLLDTYLEALGEIS